MKILEESLCKTTIKLLNREDIMKPAFIIIDVQEDYCKMKGFKDQIADASMYINEVSKYFRDAKLPVIHVQHKEKGKSVVSPVSNKIVQEDTDIYVVKEYGNAFWKTILENILVHDEVDFLVLSGLAASQCVLATYNGALERNFNVVLLQNGLMDHKEESVKFVQQERNLISYPAVRYLIEQFKG